MLYASRQVLRPVQELARSGQVQSGVRWNALQGIAGYRSSSELGAAAVSWHRGAGGHLPKWCNAHLLPAAKRFGRNGSGGAPVLTETRMKASAIAARSIAVAIFLIGAWATFEFVRLYVQAIAGGATGQWQMAVFYTPAPALLSLLAMGIWRMTGRLQRSVLTVGITGVVLPLIIAVLMLSA